MTDSVQVPARPKISKAFFGQLPDGTSIFQHTLINNQGMNLNVIDYGGIITSLTAPDKQGKLEDIVLGFDSLSQYLESSTSYFGALIGRYGNRIAKGRFSLDGKIFQLAQNNGSNNLHGGPIGFDQRTWTIEEYAVDNGAALKLLYHSKDMEEGFPGDLHVEVIYHLTDKNELKIYYRATTNKETIINLTQHTYFNLSGNSKNDIQNHVLMINADKFIPIDKMFIPTGELKEVIETPFDFKTPATIGSRLSEVDQQLQIAGGYDHCWVLKETSDPLKLAATLHDPSNGRMMTVYTTEPGIQFYAGNFLDGSVTGKFNAVYHKGYGLCLETEHFPDSPNQKLFPSVKLNPGEIYESKTIYSFTTR